MESLLHDLRAFGMLWCACVLEAGEGATGNDCSSFTKVKASAGNNADPLCGQLPIVRPRQPASSWTDEQKM